MKPFPVYDAVKEGNTQELETVTEEPKLKIRKSNDSLYLLFDATTRKRLSSTLSRGLRVGYAFLTNADEETRSTHLIKIEVYNLQKINEIPPNGHRKYADFKIKFYAIVSNKNYQNTKKKHVKYRSRNYNRQNI
ncbi:Uncharacterized protein OBRU01_25158 [Operophtera brumata]|uniref:Uncharacterized protein n=1 Tax=Operophtera brumata TaxID=104452 RepID=A0A0L7KFQ1_OPEBR|nr:Uncharacterized protein OBRU01_25158 [Operophtera brumata]